MLSYLFCKIKPYINKIVQAALVFGAAFLVLLYCLGYYDIAFLDRDALFGNNTVQASTPSYVDTKDQPEKETAAQSLPANEETSEKDPALSEKETITNLSKVYDTASFPDEFPVPTERARALEEGCTIPPADGSYLYDHSRTILAKLTIDLPLPTSNYSSLRTVVKDVVVTPDEATAAWKGDAKYTEKQEVEERIHAVELYMGYILLHNGEGDYILSSDGTPLCRYDGTRYFPAYTRDLSDRPLFLREDEDGTRYFYLSEDGTSFVLSDYNPATDGRGLYFDYPASYGKSDPSGLYVTADTYLKTTEATWQFGEEFVLALARGDEEALQKAAGLDLPTDILYGYEARDENGNSTRVIPAVYAMAYPYSEELAAVVTNSGSRQELYFINRYGYRTFAFPSIYVNEHDRYVIDSLLPPLTTGIESIGHFFYQDGVVRARRQIIDYYNYTARGRTLVVKEYDCLLRTDGSEVELPAGFTLEAYSESVAILQKDGVYGVYHLANGWIAQPIYADASPSLYGLIPLQLSDGRWGMIDGEGNLVLPFTYDYISTASSGLVAAYRKENGWTVYCMLDSEN